MSQKPTTGLVVDGSCRPNPGKVEWRGVDLATGKQVFRAGPYPGGTNNVAELLAIIHALSLDHPGPIYTDSQTALVWLRTCGANARAFSPQLSDILARGKAKLATIPDVTDRVRFWSAASWGENPADFGYKR